MQHAHAPALGQPRHLRQLVAHAGGEDQALGGDRGAVLERDHEAALAALVKLRPMRLAEPDLDARVLGQLGGGVADDVGRRAPILPEKAVRMRGEAVARPPAVDHEHATTRPRQLHGGRQARETAADHDDFMV